MLEEPSTKNSYVAPKVSYSALGFNRLSAQAMDILCLSEVLTQVGFVTKLRAKYLILTKVTVGAAVIPIE